MTDETVDREVERTLADRPHLLVVVAVRIREDQAWCVTVFHQLDSDLLASVVCSAEDNDSVSTSWCIDLG